MSSFFREENYGSSNSNSTCCGFFWSESFYFFLLVVINCSSVRFNVHQEKMAAKKWHTLYLLFLQKKSGFWEKGHGLGGFLWPGFSMNQIELGALAVCTSIMPREFSLKRYTWTGTWPKSLTTVFYEGALIEWILFDFFGRWTKIPKKALSHDVMFIGNEECSNNDVASSQGHIKLPVPARDCGKKQTLFDHRYLSCGIRRSSFKT